MTVSSLFAAGKSFLYDMHCVNYNLMFDIFLELKIRYCKIQDIYSKKRDE